MRYDAVDEVPVDADRWRVYAEGWQSWSPASWYGPGDPLRRPDEAWQHRMRFRPGADLPGDGLQADGVLVVDPGDGSPVRTYRGATLPDAVPSLRATADGGHIVVSATGDVSTGVEPDGAAAALAAVGDAIGGHPIRPAPRVWCSWYRYFEDVTAADIEENLDAFDRYELPVDVVQIDDGWSTGLGDGLRPVDGFDELPALVERIRSTGRHAGIWMAPFLVGADTELAREHPDWLVGSAGHNWGQDLVGLDLTHPGVRELLAATFDRLRTYGISYVKLDFLYGGALPGDRHEDVDPIAAYRSGLTLIRQAVGGDAYLVGCGAPLLPSVGLVDAMRVSPDTYHEGGQDGSEGLRGKPPLVARAWQHGRLWVNDPDCLITDPRFALREEWADTVRRYGGLRSFSDRVADLDDWGLATTRDLLAERADPAPFDDEPLVADA